MNLKETDLFWTAIITILSVAYPILFQVISQLEEKYSSDHIVELFKKEMVNKWFKRNLFIALISILVWYMGFEPFVDISGFQYFIDNSAEIIIVIFSVIVVINFLLLLEKVTTYVSPSKFTNYLIKIQSKSKEPSHYIDALGDMLIHTIKSQNQNASISISRYLYTAFQNERQKSKDNPVEYPEVYYRLVYRTIEELAIQKEKRNYPLESRTSGNIWLLGEFSSVEISELTYTWIWRNILLAINYEKDDYIINHWQTAHQYMSFSLDHIQREYGEGTERMKVINQNEIDKREKERQRFLDFHYALGGLLMYKQKYNCLRRLFEYTTSQPPKYELLPSSMGEVFFVYNRFRDPYELQFPWISSLYPFPDQEGINSGYVIKKWICSYTALLFLRQYSIQPYLITQRPLDFPLPPKNRSEITKWIEGIEFFKQEVGLHLLNTSLLQQVNLDFISNEWCNINYKPIPLEFITNFKLKLEEKYQSSIESERLSEEKVKLFENNSGQIVSETIQRYLVINNKKTFYAEFDYWRIRGRIMPYSKDAFSESPEAHYFDFDNYLGKLISSQFIESIGKIFKLKLSNSYILHPKDIFKGIDKLKITKEHVIIGIGINLNIYLDVFQIQGLCEKRYKETDIYLFDGSRAINGCFYVLKKDDLPHFSFLPLDEIEIEKYSLNPLDSNENIYYNVIDLNGATDELKIEAESMINNDEINKSVLLDIAFNFQVKWKKGITMVRISEYSEYREKGLSNELSDLEEI